MAGYTEWAPSAALAGVLACVWSRTTDPGPARSLRIVPDGCLDLIWSGDRLWVAGPDTRAWVEETEPGTMVGVRFAPGVAPAVLGLPASELRDDRPALAEVGPGAELLAERLAENPGRADAILQAAVSARLRREALDPAVPAVLAGLRTGTGAAEIAWRLGMTERTLHRRCLAAFGYGPKTTQRVLRFQRALRLARAGVPFADTAVRAGYADQPHLSREVRALAGVPLGELIRAGRSPAG